MEKIYVFQHYNGGEVVEQGASFDLEKIKGRVKEIEDEVKEQYEESYEDTDTVWSVHPNENREDVLYYTFEYYAAESDQDFAELIIYEIPYIN